MRSSVKKLRDATVVLGTAAAIASGWNLVASKHHVIEKTIGNVTAIQISATEWTLNCLACADVATEICRDFRVVSEELDYGSMWHTTIKCAS